MRSSFLPCVDMKASNVGMQYKPPLPPPPAPSPPSPAPFFSWLNQVEIDADDLAIGEIVGSGSFAEVRKGRFRVGARYRPGSEGLGVSGLALMTEATLSRRGLPNVFEEGTDVAVKVIRDVSRNSLKRFWFEVLIMKVG